MTDSAQNLGLYHVQGVAGTGLAGAPSLHFSLTVHAPTGAVTGSAYQFQAVAGKGGHIVIGHITGQVRHTGLAADQLLVSLHGSAVISGSGKGLDAHLAQFDAAFSVNNHWDGTGSWTLDGHTVKDAKVAQQASEAVNHAKALAAA